MVSCWAQLAKGWVDEAMIAAPYLLVPAALALGLPPIGSLALGALLGGALQLLMLLWPLARLGMLPRPRLVPRDPEVRRSLALMGPLVLGLGVYQLNILLSRLFASFLPPGSPTYLEFGMRVVEVPQERMLEVIGPSLVVTALTGDEPFIDQLIGSPLVECCI